MSESPVFQPIAIHGVEAEVLRERRMVRLPGSRGGAGMGSASLPPVHVHAFDDIRAGDHRRE
jgi:hypothetical protein